MSTTSNPTLRVLRCDIVISRLELGLTRDKYSKAELRDRLNSLIDSAGWSRGVVYPLLRPLQKLVDDFAARISTGAVTSLQTWTRIVKWQLGADSYSSFASAMKAPLLLDNN
jgi:hypothetical protein